MILNKFLINFVRIDSKEVCCKDYTIDSKNYKHLIEPFHFPGDKAGCLLLHGFTGSPSEMRPLGEYLSQYGYEIVCPLLPGHGTSIKDLESTKWKEWYRAAESEYLTLKGRHDKTYIVGLSMGGVLAMHAAQSNDIDGIVPLASGVRLKDWRITCLPVLRHLVRRVKKSRNAFARGPERTRFAYNENSSLATAEIVRFYNHVRNSLHKITAPMLMINSRGDKTVPYENVDIIMSGVKSEIKKVVTLEREDHIITLCEDMETVFKETASFLESLNHR